MLSILAFLFLSSLAGTSSSVLPQTPFILQDTPTVNRFIPNEAPQAKCFPSVGAWTPPDKIPKSNSDWWCAHSDEYAFLGFSYSSDCQNMTTLTSDFKRMRRDYNARYVRLYEACDAVPRYLSHVIDAAWQAGLGVHPLIWFGFDGDDAYKQRMQRVLHDIHANPYSKFVVRSIVVGSEPLYDNAISADGLADLVYEVRKNLSSLYVPVTVSEMAYGYELRNDAPQVFEAVDFIQTHVLPFFDGNATTADAAGPSIESSVNYFLRHGQGKRLMISQTGWPSNSEVWKPNSPDAVSSIAQEANYVRLLDGKCEYFKKVGPKGGIGWFFHIFAENMLPGWGLVRDDGSPKFAFSARTTC